MYIKKRKIQKDHNYYAPLCELYVILILTITEKK